MRHSDISYKHFKLIADNSIVESLYDDHEIDPSTDIELSRNESIEIALLLSGLRDVHIVQEMKKVAEEVRRFSNPPRGERLLAETLGIPIGEKINHTMLLPCSDLRDNVAAQTQSKAIREALNEFIEDHSRMDPILNKEHLKKNIRVTDVRPIPSEITCGKTSSIRTKTNCFEIDIRLDNTHDNTHYIRTYGLHIKSFETNKEENNNRITWDIPEYLFKKPGWNNKEQQIIDDVTAVIDQKSELITGIGRYPYCNGLIRNHVYRIRTIIRSKEKGACNLAYLIWISAQPHPVIIEFEIIEKIQNAGKWDEVEPLFNVLFEKEDEIPSSEKIIKILNHLGFQKAIKSKRNSDEELVNSKKPFNCEDIEFSSEGTKESKSFLQERGVENEE